MAKGKSKTLLNTLRLEKGWTYKALAAKLNLSTAPPSPPPDVRL